MSLDVGGGDESTENATNKTTNTGETSYTEQSSTPSQPVSGKLKIYAKDDGNVYKQDDTGTESGLGGVSGQDDPLAIPSSASAVDNTDWSATAVGPNADASADFNLPSETGVAIGDQADSKNGLAIGTNATISFTGGMVIGNAASNNKDGIVIGKSASKSATGGGIVIGNAASTSVGNGVVIGQGESVATANVGRIGVDQLVFGGTRDTIADADINNGELTAELDETNSAFRLRGKDSGGVVREATIAW